MRRAPSLLVSFTVVLLVGASEFPEYPDDPSAFTTVIEAREYDDRFETVADLLGHVAGVRVRRYGGLGAFSTASVRGAKSERVLVLLDGVRLNSAYRGTVDLSTLPIRTVERIEVVRGGGAARYGSAAVGGVISITTRRGEAEPGIDASGFGGDMGTLGGDVLVSGRHGRLGVALAYDRLRSDNDFRFDRSLRGLGGFFPGLPLAETRHTRLGAGFLKQTGMARLELDAGRDRGLVGTLHLHETERGQPGSTHGPAPVGSPDDLVSCPHATEENRRAVGSLAFNDRRLGPGSLEVALSHRFEKWSLHDPAGLCNLINPVLRNGRDRLESTETETGISARFAGSPIRIGPATLKGRSAVTVRLEQWRGDDSEDLGQWVATFFLQEDLGLFEGRLRLVPALGFEGVHSREVRVRDPTQNGVWTHVRPDHGGEWLPRLGAIVRVAPWLRLKANYARSYRRPTFQELFLPDQGFIRGNPHLRSESAWGFDVGLEARHRGAGWLRDLRLEAVYFERDLDDPIEFVQINQVTFEPRNLPPSVVEGIEVQGSLLLAGRLELHGSYTHLDARLERTGTPLPHRPENRWFGRAALNVGAGRAWAELTYEDEVPLSATGLITADAASQVDVGLSVRLGELFRRRSLRGLTLSSEWVNVTDQERVDSLGLPLPGRTWYLRLRGTSR